MKALADTIVAPITALGGAVATIRVSGPQAWVVASQVFTPWPTEVRPRYAYYGRFCSGDDGLVLPFAAGHSYTGELCVEMSVHGSRVSVQSLLNACLSTSCRLAEPGEFTYRAFMNGKLDLTQAEGVRDTVNAVSDSQLRQAVLLREGALREQIHAVQDVVLGMLAAVEASTDFSEEVGEVDSTEMLELLLTARIRIAELLRTADRSRVLREGLTVAIVGRPNAGKSSLLNAIVGADRAIVTDLPGTTRDTVEEAVSLEGTLLRFIDTAGLRESGDVVEQIGVNRTRIVMSNADHVLYVFDSSEGWIADDTDALGEISRPKTVVANKIDLGVANELSEVIGVSARTGQGIDDLLKHLIDVSGGVGTAIGFVNRRHKPLLESADKALAEVQNVFQNSMPDDLATVGLRSAHRSLGEITGETAAPDVIERVFHDFCIGK